MWSIYAEFRFTALRTVGAEPKASGTVTQQSAGLVKKESEGKEILILSEWSFCFCDIMSDSE